MIKQRTAVVTGVSGGIGSATAHTFLEAGWNVVGLDRVRPGEAISKVEFRECDISDADSVQATCAEILATHRVDTLVNNAAIQVSKPLTETTNDEWALVMDTNVRGAFICIRELFPKLAECKGSVVNVASVHAVATSSNISAYAASKGALVALTRAVAVELAEAGIRCNAVLPGAVDTAMLHEGLSRQPDQGTSEQNLLNLTSRTPLGIIANPFSIAQTILYLADGDKSGFVTGQSLIADGGATARLSTE